MCVLSLNRGARFSRASQGRARPHRMLRLTLCKEIPPGFIPSLFRALANLPPEVAWDRGQKK